ncbi:unnamed protein product [Lota lota]
MCSGLDGFAGRERRRRPPPVCDGVGPRACKQVEEMVLGSRLQSQDRIQIHAEDLEILRDPKCATFSAQL